MPLNLDDLNRPRTRWVPLDGHLAGVEIHVRFFGTQDSQRFRNQLEGDGIIRVTRENPLAVNLGREAAFFEAMAAKYVIDWRGNIQPEGAPYDPKKMGAVLAAYPRSFELLMQAVGDENRFFPSEPEDSTKN